MAVDLLLCAATELECALLRERLAGNRRVQIVRTGVGPVNAAVAVTTFLASNAPHAIVVCGIGGAYPASGLRVGDVACAGSECYGDLGAASPTGFLDMKALGFPVIESPTPLYNDLPMQVFPTEIHVRRVKFVTVNTCTGTADAANSIEMRTGGAVENMEGAAVAHVALLYRVPVGEVRGISNMVTDRDPKAWKIKEAAAAAQEAVLAWIARR